MENREANWVKPLRSTFGVMVAGLTASGKVRGVAEGVSVLSYQSLLKTTVLNLFPEAIVNGVALLTW